MLQSRKIRDQKGAAITGLVIALMFFMLIAGLFAFDASRVQMAQRELTATCDASALAGTAMLTSYDVSDDPGYIKLGNAQQNAAAYAYNMFQMGNVLGRFVQGHCTPVATLSALGTSTDGNCN
nr:Tad domain-containing protein [bacterium]